MTDGEATELITEADQEPVKNVKTSETYGFTTGDPRLMDLTNHAKALREALENSGTALMDDEAYMDNKGNHEDLIKLVSSCKSLERTPDFESRTPKPCCNINQYTPKSFDEAIWYLEKIKVQSFNLSDD
jgi:hypothetical protein